MLFRRLVSLICVVNLLTVSTNISFTQETNSSAADEIAKLEKQISELEKKVSELQKLLAWKPEKADVDTAEAIKSEDGLLLEQELAAEFGGTQPEGIRTQTTSSTQVSGTRGGIFQNMNPNIGVIGNFVGSKVVARQDEEDGFTFDEAELSFQMVIDPFARADAFVAVVPPEEAVELEEAFITLLALPSSLQGRVGLFRPQFGKLNLTHPPETPFADQFPLVLRNYFGEEALAETGATLSYLIPNPWGLFLEVNLGIFDGDNEESFNGDETSDLLYFGHLKSFFDLTDNSSIELGFSGLTGKNDPEGDLRSNLYGMDFIYRWKPLRLNQYKSFTLQSEFLFSNRNEALKDINSWGMFSFVEYQLSKRWFLGGRFDYSEFPTSSEDREIAYSAILTFWPSEFQTIRLQYRHLNRNFDEDDNAIFFQWVFITGAHGAHAF